MSAAGERCFGVLAVLLALGAGPCRNVRADEADAPQRSGEDLPWIEKGTHDGVRVFLRQRHGQRVKEVKAVGIIQAPSWRVWRVIGDYNGYRYFMPYTEDSRLLRREGPVAWFYSYLDLPWPIGNRYYTIRIVHAEEGEGRYRSEWDLAEGIGSRPRKGGVATPVNRGSWRLEPLGEDRTLLTYVLLTDPGGLLPAWAVDLANRQALPDLFRAIRTQVKKPWYDDRGQRAEGGGQNGERRRLSR